MNLNDDYFLNSFRPYSFSELLNIFSYCFNAITVEATTKAEAVIALASL